MKLFIFFFCFSFVVCNVNADVFKCIDDSGKPIYKDKECNDNERFSRKFETVELSKKISNIKIDIDDTSPLGKNLILNYSFENNLMDWKVPLGAFWSPSGGKNKSEALIMHVKKPPDDKYIHEVAVEQCVLLGKGDKFELAADFMSLKVPKEPFANRINIIWYESIDCTTGGQFGGYAEPKINVNNWQRVSRNNLVPALGAKAAKIRIVQRGRFSNDGEAIWDNISFMATEIFEQSEKNIVQSKSSRYTLKMGENYVVNGTFNKDISSWRPGLWKLGWLNSRGDITPGVIKVEAISDKGGIGAGAFSQCVNFGENSMFELGASFKRDESSTQKGGGRLRVTWYEKMNCTGRGKTDVKSADPKYVKGWQKLRATGLRAPKGAKSAVIEIIQSVQGNGNFTVYWDDIFFKAIE